jgi:hypothetical protein
MCNVYMKLDPVQKPGPEVLEFEKMWSNQNQMVQILKELAQTRTWRIIT